MAENASDNIVYLKDRIPDGNGSKAGQVLRGIGFAGVIGASAAALWLLNRTPNDTQNTALHPFVVYPEIMVDCQRTIDGFQPRDETDLQIRAGTQPVFSLESLDPITGRSLGEQVMQLYGRYAPALISTACEQYGQEHGGVAGDQFYHLHAEAVRVDDGKPDDIKFIVSVENNG